MIKVAIIGFGGISAAHFEAYKRMQDVKVIAVAEVREDMARKKLVDFPEIKVYPCIEELLENEKPDIIDVCTPTYTHKDITIKAIESGANVFCEKPMAIDSISAREMLEASKKSDKLFMIGHVLRFMKPYVYLKNVLESNELGKPLHFNFKRLSKIPDWGYENWFWDREKSGGSLLDLSIHDIDFCKYIFGNPKKASVTYYKMKNNNDFVESQLIYDDFLVTVTGAFYACDYGFSSEYTAVFENGYVKLKDGKIYKNGKEVEEHPEEISEDLGINISDIGGHEAELIYYVDCVKKGVTPDIVTFEDACGTIELVERLLNNCTEI